MQARKHICIVSTVPFVLNWFMEPHINQLKKYYDVTLVSSGKDEDVAGLLDNNVKFIHLHIERKVSLVSDTIALYKLWRLFRKNKFYCIHSIMPKSGLLAMLAAKISGVPIRIHTFTGQVWATKSGFSRFILMFLDRFLVFCATKLLTDGHSQRLFLIENKIVNEDKIKVLGDGSISGIDTDRFRFNLTTRNRIRLNHGISESSFVFLYLGRLKREKGLVELSQAFSEIAKVIDDVHLFVIGPDEDNLEIFFSLLEQKFPDRIHRVGLIDNPEDYLTAADVLCLPSYREGFPNVPLQAASVGLPTIGSRIYGITDAVEEGVTGILHAVGSVREMTDAMLLLVSNNDYRNQLGRAAKKRVIEKFTEERVSKEFLSFYNRTFKIHDK